MLFSGIHGKRSLIFATGFLAVILLLSASRTVSLYYSQGSSEKQLTIFVGAAAAPLYREVASIFESKFGVKVLLNIGGSGSLLSSLEITRTGDAYIPGSPEYLILADQKNIVNLAESAPRIFAYMVLAIIVQKGNPSNITTLEDLARPGIRIAIADPKSVCVGLYAKELLENAGLWNDVNKNIVVYAHSCEALANLIPLGVVDAVIGWHVFYYWYPDKADIVWIEPTKIPKIGYIAGAVTTFSKNRHLAEKFLDFLASKDVRDIWARYGYFPTLEDARDRAPNAIVVEL